MAIIANQRSTEEWEMYIGHQFRALRIRAGVDQLTLAAHANTSIGAIKNLEHGKGSSLRTIIKVVRALNCTDWLEALTPTITVSPMQMLKTKRNESSRTKVYRPRKPKISE